MVSIPKTITTEKQPKFYFSRDYALSQSLTQTVTQTGKITGEKGTTIWAK